MKPYWEDDSGVLYHGDCLEVMKKLKTDKEKIILITDPPYGINYDPRFLSKIHLAKGTPANLTDEKITNDKGELDLTFLFEFKKRLIFGFPYIYDKKATGWIVWDKQPQINWRGLTTPVEIASTTLRKGYDLFHCMWAGFLRDKSNHEKRYKHPTQKPLKLIRGIIERFTKENDLILDPFAGSGTTLRAAKDLGRKYIGIEIEEKYCEIAAKRLGQEVLFN